MPGPFGCCSKRGSVDVVPIEPNRQPQQNGLPGLAGATAAMTSGGAAGSEDSSAGRRGTLGTSSSSDERKSVTIEGGEAAPHFDYFDVRIQTGSGTQFTLSVHDGLKVNDVHKLISKHLGEYEHPSAAIRLIRGAKVMSHRAQEPISAFEIAAGDLLQMVVGRAAHRSSFPPLPSPSPPPPPLS